MSTAVDIDPTLHGRLETMLVSAADSAVPWLDTALGRLLRRPGKRLRPALVLTAAACGPAAGAGPDMSTALTCAAAVELLHQSSLIHDDLMDGATFRGNQATLHTTDGPAGAVLGGDYLIAVGGRMVSEVGPPAAVVWHEAYRGMCAGQARETANRYHVTPEEEYLLTIEGKTAGLIRAACQLGGLCARADEAQVRALAEFGRAFGMLFQLLDDLMDVVSTPALWGKPVQHDITFGIYTLPVLATARSAGAPLAGLIGPHAPAAAVSMVYERVRAIGVPPALRGIHDWVIRAREALNALPPSMARDRLAALPEQYVTGALTHSVPAQYRDLVAPFLRNNY
jgi:geranylgeranyl pyrophosphate synthase